MSFSWLRVQQRAEASRDTLWLRRENLTMAPLYRELLQVLVLELRRAGVCATLNLRFNCSRERRNSLEDLGSFLQFPTWPETTQQVHQQGRTEVPIIATKTRGMLGRNIVAHGLPSGSNAQRAQVKLNSDRHTRQWRPARKTEASIGVEGVGEKHSFAREGFVRVRRNIEGN